MFRRLFFPCENAKNNGKVLCHSVAWNRIIVWLRIFIHTPESWTTITNVWLAEPLASKGERRNIIVTDFPVNQCITIINGKGCLILFNTVFLWFSLPAFNFKTWKEESGCCRKRLDNEGKIYFVWYFVNTRMIVQVSVTSIKMEAALCLFGTFHVSLD